MDRRRKRGGPRLHRATLDVRPEDHPWLMEEGDVARDPVFLELIVRARIFGTIVLEYVPAIINDIPIREFPDELIPVVVPKVVESAKAVDAVLSPNRGKHKNNCIWDCVPVDRIINSCKNTNSKVFIYDFLFQFYTMLYSWGWPGKWRDTVGTVLASPLPLIIHGVQYKTISSYILDCHFMASMTCLDHHSAAHRALNPEPVILGATKDENPIVFDRMKIPLTTKQFAVVSALLRAGPQGLSLKELNDISGGARGILNDLRRADPEWGSAIHLPGRPGGRYRIGPYPHETHTLAKKSTLPTDTHPAGDGVSL